MQATNVIAGLKNRDFLRKYNFNKYLFQKNPIPIKRHSKKLEFFKQTQMLQNYQIQPGPPDF